MKYVYAFLFCILCTSTIQPTVDEQTDTAEEHQSTEMTESPVMPSVAQWDSCARVLQDYQRKEQSYRTTIGSSLHDYTTYASAVTVSAIIGFAGHWIFTDLFEDYVIIHGALARLFAASGIMSVGAVVINRCIELLGRLLQSKARDNAHALEDFLNEWAQHKEETPALLHPLFDVLAKDVTEHGEFTKITQDQASFIVEKIIATASLGAAMTEAFGIRMTRSDPDDSLPELVQLFLATKLTIDLDFHECHLSCYQTVDSKARKDQWEFLARQLGIIKQPSSWQKISEFFDKYQRPLSFLVGVPVGFIGGHELINYFVDDYQRYLPYVRLIGPSLGVAGVAFMSALIGRASHDTSWRKEHLTNFIMRWKGHKTNTPSCLHNLFEHLYRLYLKNHKSLNLDAMFIDELYQLILEAWIYAVMPTTHQPSSATQNGSTVAITANNTATVNVTQKEEL